MGSFLIGPQTEPPMGSRLEGWGSWHLTGPLNSLIWPSEARFAAQPWGCSASTSCGIFTACCCMFPGNHWTRLPPHSDFNHPACIFAISTKPYGWFCCRSISRWSEGGALWQIAEERKEMEEGAAGLISEAWLVSVIVRLRCQPWQWNMISPSPSSP